MLNTFLKVFSGIMMLFSAGLAVFDFVHAQYFWGALMIGCFFLNLRTFRKCCED